MAEPGNTLNNSFKISTAFCRSIYFPETFRPGCIKGGDNNISLTQVFPYFLEKQLGTVCQNSHRLVCFLFDMSDYSAQTCMQRWFTGCCDGKKIKVTDTFFIIKKSINFGYYFIRGDMLSPSTGHLGCPVDFAIYTIKIAGFRRQKINALGKPQSSRVNRAK